MVENNNRTSSRGRKLQILKCSLCGDEIWAMSTKTKLCWPCKSKKIVESRKA